MREIKFRAWDGEKMMYGVAVMNGTAYTLNSDGFLYRYTNYGKISKPIPSQSTGLKDKNGVEIYEGDVCHIFTGDKTEIVFYMAAFGYWIWNNKTYRKFILLCQDNISVDNIEVVGNIYKNKEFLKETAE